MSINNRYTVMSKFPVLLRFLSSFVGYYDGIEFVGLNESEAALRYISVFSPKDRGKIISEGKAILSELNVPWNEMSSAAFRHFVDEAAARQWLNVILSVAETAPPRVGRFFIDVIPREVNKLLKKRYPRLFSFFTSEFIKSSYQVLSDTEIAKRYAEINSPKLIRGLIEEGNTFLSDATFPWQEVNKEAVKSFDDDKDFREWVAEIITILKKPGLPEEV